MYIERKNFEFKRYKHARADINHAVFDYAKEVLLPRLVVKPRQMHFFSGFNFELFGDFLTKTGWDYM